MPSITELEFSTGDRGRTPALTATGTRLVLHAPVSVTTMDGHTSDHAYDAVTESAEGTWHARVDVVLPDGTHLRVEDTYLREPDGAVSIARDASVLASGTTEGLRIGIDAHTQVSGAHEPEWQYFVPGAIYNRNDSDGDGREDYLGTYVHDHRDDHNGILAVLTRHQPSGATFSLARTTLPAFDTAITPEQLSARYFVQSTDIGSLGTRPLDDGQVGLRASWPFSEEVSFSLDTAGTGWAAFAPNKTGPLVRVTYRLELSSTPDLTEAIWDIYESQRRALGTTAPTPGVSLEDSVEHRQLMTQLYYRKWEPEENPNEPAGYLVHFSPRTGETLGSLIEFGFSGDQTLLAYTQMIWGRQKNVPLYVHRARTVIDFFVRHAQHENGYSDGIYDPLHDRFTHWFTGILMPFQYATDAGSVRRYVGSQIAEALAPIAAELRTVEGNYLRTMCESIYPILLAYEIDDTKPDEWLAAVRRFGEFLLRTQAEDGSWYRAYSPSGDGLTSPAAWFGASYAEQKSGTIFPIPILTGLHRLTGEERYLRAAERAADFIITTFVDPVLYVGGLNDTTHVKSVKTDSVGLMFLTRSLLKVYQATDSRRYLEAAVKSAKILASFVYLWDVPMPEGSLLAQAGFKSTGWAVCDVIAGGGYLDNEFLEFTGDLVNVAAAAGNEALFDVAELVEYGMQYAVSTPDNDHGYVAPGIQCEGVMTGYWLSTPDQTEFSGAVAKVKGDDNDTCNALTAGQAAYGVYDLIASHGTADFSAIRKTIFGN